MTHKENHSEGVKACNQEQSNQEEEEYPHKEEKDLTNKENQSEGVKACNQEQSNQEEEEYPHKEEKDLKDQEDDTSLKFPSYEEFLKEDEEENGEHEEGNPDLDDALASFLDEIKKFSAVKPEGRGLSHGKILSASSTVKSFGTSEQECIRLTSRIFPSMYQILLLGPDATDEDIRKQYRKLSLLIHPDKCKHPKAQEAFHVITKAYENLQKPENRQRYNSVLEEAKRNVLKERKKENKQRRIIGEELLTEDLSEMQQEIMDACEKLLDAQKERREYAEKTRAANERYEIEMLEKQQAEEHEASLKRRKLAESQNTRVEEWRTFQNAIRNKEIDFHAFKGIRHMKEARKDDDLLLKKKKAHGVDTSYKDNWR